MRQYPDSNWGMKDLQSKALPTWLYCLPTQLYRLFKYYSRYNNLSQKRE